MKVILNAEAFGFGPSAAIASLFPDLKNCSLIKKLSYIGDGHSLDLQRNLSYDEIIDCDDEKEFKEIVSRYDVFITALDFKKALWAQESGVKVMIYDTLIWYWRKIPSVLYNCHAYIVQDFYGVSERLKQLNIKNFNLIAPSIKPCVQTKCEKDLILINFGGLENPHWTIEVTTNYIVSILEILIPLLNDHEYKIVCSKAHLPYLKGFPVAHVSYEEMQELLNQTKFLIATPGLGNIYETANYSLPSLFLPPANDSQGQQLDVLKAQSLVDNYIDWSDIYAFIDYKNPQLVVLDAIKSAISNQNKNKLSKMLESKILSLQINAKIPYLIERFKNQNNLSQTVINYLEKLNAV